MCDDLARATEAQDGKKASKHLHNDLARAIKALEKKKNIVFFGWIRFCYWAGREGSSDDCNVFESFAKLAGLQQACPRFEIRFFV